MRGLPRATGCVAQFPGSCLGQGDDLANVLHRHGRMHDKHAGQKDQHRHRDEILERIEPELWIQARVGREGGGSEQPQHVAIRGRLRDEFRVDVPARPQTTLYNDLLFQRFRNLLTEYSSDVVAGSARLIGDADTNGLDRVLLCIPMTHRQRAQRGSQNNA